MRKILHLWGRGHYVRNWYWTLEVMLYFSGTSKGLYDTIIADVFILDAEYVKVRSYKCTLLVR